MTESPTPEPRKSFPRTLTTLVAVAAVGAGAGVGAYAVVDSNELAGSRRRADHDQLDGPADALKTTSGSLIDLYKRTSPGVVDITVTSTTTSDNSFNGSQQQSSSRRRRGRAS